MKHPSALLILVSSTMLSYGQQTNRFAYGDFEEVYCTDPYVPPSSATVPSAGASCWDQPRWPGCGTTWWGYQRQLNGAFTTQGMAMRVANWGTGNSVPLPTCDGNRMMRISFSSPTYNQVQSAVVFQRVNGLIAGHEYMVRWMFKALRTSGNDWSFNFQGVAGSSVGCAAPVAVPQSTGFVPYEPITSGQPIMNGASAFSFVADDGDDHVAIAINSRITTGTGTAYMFLDNFELYDLTTALPGACYNSNMPLAPGRGEAPVMAKALLPDEHPEATHPLLTFPNPATSELTVNTTALPAGTLLSIYSTVGELVKQLPVTNSSLLSIDISDLPAGIYLIQHGDGEHSRQARFVKE